MASDIERHTSEHKAMTDIVQNKNKIEAGQYLENQRKQKHLSRNKCSQLLGVTANYINEIERGFKVPSDSLIRKMAIEYRIDEDELFNKYGRVPLSIREEFNDNTILHNMLSVISQFKFSCENEKAAVYLKLYKHCQNILEDIKK